MSKKKSAHGGKREGAGRPLSIKGKKRTLYISDENWEYLVAIGGTASAGVRELINADIEDTEKQIKSGKLGF